MADSDKLIGIFPETGQPTLLPRIEFTGKDNKKVSLQTEDNNDLHFVNASGDSLLRITTSGLIVASGGDSVKWNEAYGWGDHSASGYALDSTVVKTTGDQTISGAKTFQSSILLNGADAATGGVANLTLDGSTGSTLFFDNGLLAGFDRTGSNLLFHNFAGGYLEIESNNNIAFRTNSTERINITNSGNVGIGVSAPYAKLGIYSATSGDTLLNIEGTNGNLFSVVDNMSGSLMSVNDITGLPAFEVFSDHSVVAGRFNANDFVISSGGNVGIGTAAPSGKLHISGNQYITDGSLYIHNTSATTPYTHNRIYNDQYDSLILISNGSRLTLGGQGGNAILHANSTYLELGNPYNAGTTNQYITFKPANSEAMRITSSGNVGIGTSTPLEKLHVVDNIRLNSSTTNSVITINPSGRSINVSPSQFSDIILQVNDQNIFRGLDNWTGTWADSVGTTYFQVGRSGGNTIFTSLVGNPFNRLAYSANKYLFTNQTSSIAVPSPYFNIEHNGSGILAATTTGNVGIGTASPSTKLDVSGVITATGGNSNNWNTAYGWGDHANGGYLSATGGTITNDLTIGGNLTVNGDTVVANVSSMEIEDPILTLGLASGNIVTNDTFDRGIAMVTNSGTAFMGWDNSADRFVLLSSGVATNNSGNYDAGAYGDLMLNRIYGGSGNAFIQFNVAGQNRIDIGSDTYVGSTTAIGTQSLFLSSPQLYATSSLQFPKTGTAVGTATQKNSHSIILYNSMWNGSSELQTDSTITSIASTSVNTRSRLAFLTSNEDGTNNKVERLSIVTDGKVGIGTTTPTYTLDVAGDASFGSVGNAIGATVSIKRIDNRYNLELVGAADGITNFAVHGGSTNMLWTSRANYFDIQTNSPNKGLALTTNGGSLFLNSSGNVGIGTTAPSVALDVRGASIFNEAGADFDFRVEGDTDANLLFVDASSDSVGIGTNAPSSKLTILTPNNYTGQALKLQTKAENTYSLYAEANSPAGGVVTWSWNQLNAGTTYANVLVFDRGNVGIGTQNPTAELEAVGNLIIRDGSSFQGLSIDTSNKEYFIGDIVGGDNGTKIEIYDSSQEINLVADYVNLPNIPTSTDNTVIIQTSTGYLATDEIDSRVWGNSLVDGAGSANHVAFWSDSDTLSYDSNQLYWDSTNNRLGIGTNAPQVALDVRGTTYTQGLNITNGTASRILATDANKTVQFLNTTTYPDLTELSYIKGVTSSIQTQLGNKANTNQTMFIGTTSVAINRTSAAQTLTGVSIDGNAGTVTSGVYTNRSITINGTTNQITSSAGAQDLSANRTWTLSLPQDIHSSATPTFGGLTINGTSNTRAAASATAATQIAIFNADPASTTRALVTRTPAQLLSDIGAYAATNPNGYTSNAGTVTSVAALTIGTTGTDISSTVANGTTTPVITLNIPTASASNRGALSSTDWSTFNNKVAYGDYSQSNPVFGQKGIKHNLVDNALYSAASRFDLYRDGVIWNNNNLFNLNYDQSGDIIPSGTSRTYSIVFNTKGNSVDGITYTQGSVYLSFYFFWTPTTVSGRVKDKDNVWRNITNWTNVSSNAGFSVLKGTIPGFVYMTEMEITVTAGGAYNDGSAWFAQWEYVMDRPGQFELGVINKAQTNTLWQNLNFKNNSNTTTLILASDGNINLTSSTASRILSTDASKNITALDTATYPSLTELSYVKGVTSSVQTQLNGKQAILTNPVTGTGTTNYISKWTDTTTQGNSLIYDNGTNVAIGGITNPGTNLHVYGGGSSAQTPTNIQGLFVENNGTSNSNYVFQTATGSGKTFSITNAGYVGIGTTTPSHRLQLGTTTSTSTATPETISLGGTFSSSAGGNAKLRLWTDGSNVMGLGVSSNQLDYVCSAGYSHVFYNNGSESWRITSAGVFQSNGAKTIQTSTGNLTLATAAGNGHILLSPHGTGNIAIGTAVPDAKLVVSSSTDANSVLWERGGASGTVFGHYFRSTANDSTFFKKAGIVFENGTDGYSNGKLHILNRGGIDNTNATVANAARITVLNNGNVGIGTTTPSDKLNVIGDISSGTTDTQGKFKAYGGFSQPSLLFEGFGSDGTARISTNSYTNRQLKIENDGASTTLGVYIEGDVGIGTTTPSYKLQVNGSFGATTKSFRIDHPSRPNYTLEYGSLESPYHGVRLTGRGTVIKGSGTVLLPSYLKDLIHDDENINIQITNIKHGKTIYVDEIDLNNDKFTVRVDRAKTLGELEFFWTFTGTRKDVDKLVVEREK